MMKFFVLAASVSAGAITAVHVGIKDPHTYAVSDNWVTFTPTSAGTASETITITYPDGFTVPAAPAVTAGSGITGTLQATATARVIVITGATAWKAATQITLTLAGITNPSTAGDKSITVATKTDTTVGSASVTITAPPPCPDDTTGAIVLVDDCKCGAQGAPGAESGACKKGGKCNTTTNVCSGAFSYGFTMLAVLAAFFL